MKPNRRKLIRKNETKVSWLQIIGFCLILFGIIYLFINLFWYEVNPEDIAINFLIVMLGFAFAFPDLLQDQSNGLSTMRIIVFMITNVICMLLLKIGWADGIKDLKAIGLDQYWVGLIAFVFGAKAVQSFFESKMANLNKQNSLDAADNSLDSKNKEADGNLPLADVNVIAEAIKEKGKEWVESFPNVTGLSVRNKVIGTEESDKVALIFKVARKLDKLDYGAIPDYIFYTSGDGEKYKILTDVIFEKVPEVNSMIIENSEPFPLGNSVSRKNDETGSIGLVVQKDDDPSIDYIVSCYHVFCLPELRDNNKTFSNTGKNAVLSCASTDDNGTNLVGFVVEGVMNSENDFAIARLNKGVRVDTGKNTLGVIPISFGHVFPENKGDMLTICGRTSGTKQGRIKSHSASQTVFYLKKTKSQFFVGLIEVDPIAEGGDSGGIVINNENKILGLVIATSTESSYVLPIKEFLLQRNYSLKTV